MVCIGRLSPRVAIVLLLPQARVQTNCHIRKRLHERAAHMDLGAHFVLSEGSANEDRGGMWVRGNPESQGPANRLRRLAAHKTCKRICAPTPYSGGRQNTNRAVRA